MNKHRLRIAPEAEADTLGIGEYTKETWGWRQQAAIFAKFKRRANSLQTLPPLAVPAIGFGMDYADLKLVAT